jgi:hypothetical protein
MLLRNPIGLTEAVDHLKPDIELVNIPLISR